MSDPPIDLHRHRMRHLANDPDWVLANPSLHIEGAWLQVTDAVKQVEDSMVRDILWSLVSVHLTAHLMERCGKEDLSARLLETRIEHEIRLFEYLDDLIMEGEDNPDDEDRIAALLNRLKIDWPRLSGGAPRE